MCRLFFSYKTTSTDTKIYDFLKQSHQDKPYTPSISNVHNHGPHLDGFGIAWIKTRKWNVYKSPKYYLDDSKIDTKIREISKETVIGHIRNRLINTNIVSLENTHPFLYKNQVFEHNGKIIDWGEKIRNKLRPFISDNLFPKIKGETDTEWLFFIYLTILKKKKYSIIHRENLHLAMEELFQLLKLNDIQILANFIYSNLNYAVITRYTNYEEEPLSLYYHREPDDGFLITSEPITENYTLVPKNTTIIVDYKEESAHLQLIR